MNQIILTNNELEIMNVMWETGRPLSRSEIIDLSPNRSWKSSSIHILLNKMLDKGVIAVDGFVKTGKNYGRTFVPLISEDDYFVSQIKDNASKIRKKPKAMLSVFAALLDDAAIDNDTLYELEEMIQAKKD